MIPGRDRSCTYVNWLFQMTLEASRLLFYRDRVCIVQVVNLSTSVSPNDLDL